MAFKTFIKSPGYLFRRLSKDIYKNWKFPTKNASFTKFFKLFQSL